MIDSKIDHGYDVDGEICFVFRYKEMDVLRVHWVRLGIIAEHELGREVRCINVGHSGLTNKMKNAVAPIAAGRRLRPSPKRAIA